ncbi:MAG: beta-lactamase family protein [Rhodomicrobium sp.]|nr:beta-lactamase family protein [Rhodomicrobium sp.]
MTVFIGLVAATAADSSAASDSQLDIMLERIRRDHAIPALAVGVVDAGEVQYLRTLGAPPRARFRAASISKLLTAQSIVRLSEDGTISLDDDLGRHLQAFAERGVTLRHLLTHTSGMADGPRPQNRSDHLSIEAYVQRLAITTQQAPPGAAWRYTDSEYNLLGAVITSVTGRAFEDYVLESLFAPIDADGASMYALDRAHLLAPHINYGVAVRVPSRPFDIVFAPSEGLVTDIESLTRWMAATLNHDSRLLMPETFEAMLTPRYGDHAALGWQVGVRNGRHVAQHGGSFTGWSALLLTYPDQRRGFVILTNAHDAPRWAIVDAIEAVLDGRSPTRPPLPWERLAVFWCALVFMTLVANFAATIISRRRLMS